MDINQTKITKQTPNSTICYTVVIERVACVTLDENYFFGTTDTTIFYTIYMRKILSAFFFGQS